MTMRAIRPEPGGTIDGFELVERIHGGAMGMVWTVRREGEPGALVMKIPVLAEGEDVSAIVGFEVEQMILPRLTGPHVPHFLAAGDFTQTPYLVMEKVQGDSLRGLLDELPLPPERVAAIGASVARALQDIHRQHVLHLDLKPANIMLRPNGEAVFLDFGLSRHDELPDLLGEESDVPMGTGAYMSPEQVFGERTEPRSDIYAIGVILYQLVTGELPFGSPQRRPGIMRRLWRDPVPPRARNPACPPWLQEIILRCLEVDPDARYGTPAQLAFALSHGDQVALTERGRRLQRDGAMTVFKRWLQARRTAPKTLGRVTEHLDSAPIIVAAVDLSSGVDALAEALRVQVRRALEAQPAARLACLTVRKTALLALDQTLDAEGNHVYVQRLVELKNWVGPLALAEDRVSFHVLEAVDPAAAIVDYARHNQVDQIILGARASSALRRYLGSVSSQVVAQAPCTVTVVRRSGAGTEAAEEG
jgi:nucleotide-binding universal stress UspA family protein